MLLVRSYAIRVISTIAPCLWSKWTSLPHEVWIWFLQLKAVFQPVSSIHAVLGFCKPRTESLDLYLEGPFT